MSPDDDTVLMVELRELTDLARLGLSMLRAQEQADKRRARLDELKLLHTAGQDAALCGLDREAARAEEQFRGRARDAIRREKQPLPGMGEEGGGSP